MPAWTRRSLFCASVVLGAGSLGCGSEAPPHEAFEGPVLRTHTDEDTGVVVEVLREGEGRAAAEGDRVELHYRLELDNGAEVDVSPRGKPLSFLVGGGSVIDGMHPAVRGMKPGERRRATIPAKYAYGRRGIGKIPAGATLIFHMEMVDVHPGSKARAQ